MLPIAEVDTAMNETLPTILRERVDRLCSTGTQYIRSHRFDAAVLSYTSAFDMLPSPKEQWCSTRPILAGIVDACFLKGDYTSAQEAIDAIRDCSSLPPAPHFHLRQGQIYFELGQFEDAGEELATAFEDAGDSIFENEHPKYLEFVRKIV
ncbi:MAG: tetratricopeptide (TPR) repeat protein [Pirellulaceae bacterium]